MERRRSTGVGFAGLGVHYIGPGLGIVNDAGTANAPPRRACDTELEGAVLGRIAARRRAAGLPSGGGSSPRHRSVRAGMAVVLVRPRCVIRADAQLSPDRRSNLPDLLRSEVSDPPPGNPAIPAHDHGIGQSRVV